MKSMFATTPWRKEGSLGSIIKATRLSKDLPLPLLFTDLSLSFRSITQSINYAGLSLIYQWFFFLHFLLKIDSFSFYDFLLSTVDIRNEGFLVILLIVDVSCHREDWSLITYNQSCWIDYLGNLNRSQMPSPR